MDFQFTSQQELLRKSVREFAEGAIAPKVPHMEETDEVPWDLYKEVGKQQYLGILIPREFGGTAFGHLGRIIMLEEVGRVSAAMAMALQIFHMGTGSIAEFGNDAQKKKYLPALARGERLGTIAVTEATGGSDPTGIQTTAKLQGDSYILNGRKCFITHGHVADTLTIMAKTGEGSKGFSAFIVEKSFPGFKLGRKEKKFGLHGCNTGEIVMENCVVPRENLLGNEGDGLKVCMTTISEVGLDERSEDPLRRRYGHGQVLCHGSRGALCQKGRRYPWRVRIHDGIPGAALLPGCRDPDRLRRHLRDSTHRHGPQSPDFFQMNYSPQRSLRTQRINKRR